MSVSNDLGNLVIARRLMRHMERLENQRKGKPVEKKTVEEEMEEDSAIISGNAPANAVNAQKAQQAPQVEHINLADLIAALKQVNQQASQAAGAAGQTTTQQVQVSFQQTITREASMSYSKLEPVEGLVRRSEQVAETDRYRFDFTNGATFTITDKWSNRATTIWGDPHVDVDDIEGESNGDFQDLKGSNTHTTFMLQDGTQLTFTALDTGVIEAVDIFKGSQHLGGIGMASKQWSDKNGLFSKAVDSSVGSSSVQQGDVVYAGGDGNDWFTAAGQLLWGKQTGPVVKNRPYATLQVQYRETIQQQLNVQVINKQA